jgi:hypothetical protein
VESCGFSPSETIIPGARKIKDYRLSRVLPDNFVELLRNKSIKHEKLFVQISATVKNRFGSYNAGISRQLLADPEISGIQ